MADIEVVTVALNSTVGNQDITITGFGTPDAVKVVMVNASADDAITSDLAISTGFYDGTTECYAGIQSLDNQSLSTTDRQCSDNALAYNYKHKITAVSFITDGIRVNNTIASSNTRATFTFYKNVSAKASIHRMTSTSLTLTSIGFEADLVQPISVGGGNTSPLAEAIFSFGYAVNDGTDKNFGVMAFDKDRFSTSRSGTYIGNNFSFGQFFNNSVSWRGSIDTYTSTGFTLRSDSSASNNDYMALLALKFDNPKNFYIDTIDSPASTGNTDYTGPNFQPDYSEILTTGNTALSTIQGSQDLIYASWQMQDAAHSSAIYSDTGVSTTDTASLSATSKLRDLISSSATLNEGTFDSFISTGVRLNFTTVAATQRKWVMFAIGDAGGGDTIIPPRIESTVSIYSPEVKNLLQILGPNSIDSSTVVYSPTVTSNDQFINPPLITVPVNVETPVIAVGAIVIEPARIESTTLVHAPNIELLLSKIEPDIIPSAVVIYTHRVIGGDRIEVPVSDRKTWNAVARYLRTVSSSFSGNDNDVIRKWFISESLTAEQYNDMWNEYLRDVAGYEGSLTDKYAKWRNE